MFVCARVRMCVHKYRLGGYSCERDNLISKPCHEEAALFNTHVCETAPPAASCILNIELVAFTSRVGQKRIYTLYMTIYKVILLPRIKYTHRIFMVLANPIY